MDCAPSSRWDSKCLHVCDAEAVSVNALSSARAGDAVQLNKELKLSDIPESAGFDMSVPFACCKQCIAWDAVRKSYKILQDMAYRIMVWS